MRVRGARTAALTLAVLLMVPGLGCAGYGVLVHVQLIAPPTLNVEIGPVQLVGMVSRPVPCEIMYACEQVSAVVPRLAASYHVWLFIAKTGLYITPRSILLLQLPIQSRNEETDYTLPQPPPAPQQRSLGYNRAEAAGFIQCMDGPTGGLCEWRKWSG
jgi:hypothetical protein